MRVCFAIPGDINIRNGGYGYNRAILALLPRFGVEVRHVQLPAGMALNDAQALDEGAAILAKIPQGELLFVDSLGFSGLSLAQIVAITAPIVAMVHHPFAQELSLSGDAASGVVAAERAALTRVQHVVVSSPYTAAQLVEDYGVPAGKIAVALPGTAPATRISGSGKAEVQLLAVGSLIPRKGYDFLLDALDGLRGLSWHLTIAGGEALDPGFAAKLKARVIRDGFSSRVTFLGEMNLSELEKCYQAADVFVMPSLFEGYGMALTEAMARGLPIISTTGGALEHTLPDGAGLKAPPADAAALRDALAQMIDFPNLRLKIAETSWQAGQKLPDWPESAEKIAQVLKNASAAC